MKFSGEEGLLLGLVVLGPAGSGPVPLLGLQRPREGLEAHTARGHFASELFIPVDRLVPQRAKWEQSGTE